MDVERQQETEGAHRSDRGNGSGRDPAREAALEQAQAAVRQIGEAAAVKAAQLERLERAVKQVAGAEAPEPEPELELPPEPEPAGTYLVFVCTPSGYGLHEARGDVPASGGRITLEITEHVVAKVGRSPLPEDDRRCAYLEPA